MSNRRLATVLVLVPLALPSAALAHTRLAGEFMMTGRITAAQAVAGEHVGETVTRTWTFLPTCPAGQCLTEELVRARAVGTDATSLRRPKISVLNYWTGEGSFFAPLICEARVYPMGERVFFRIAVQITGTTLVAGAPVATSVKASYDSYRRTNRTRCVYPAGHDAAVYTGTLVTPPTPQPAPTPAPG
ncbi:MAG: hypothetical protein M3071_17300 [Actinomycetota bacterium]|nr:hypothetical protein [Actinomycetota bacterium]